MSIQVRTEEFEMSHGKQPRGEGSWAFSEEKNPRIEDVVWFSGTYSEAKRAAKAWAMTQSRRGGISHIETLWVQP